MKYSEICSDTRLYRHAVISEIEEHTCEIVRCKCSGTAMHLPTLFGFWRA
jgi:hypothetical protein